MRSYLRIMAAAAALTVFVTSLVSWMVDPYFIRRQAAGLVTRPINDRASKIAFLARNCRQFDAYIVGNSRSQVLTGSELAGSGGNRYYNLATPGEDIGESLGRLEFLFNSGCPISSLLIGESVDVFGHAHPDVPWQRDHFLVTGENPMLFYARFFLGPQHAISYFRSKIYPSAPPMLYYPDGHVDYLWDMPSHPNIYTPDCRPQLSLHDQEDRYSRLAAYRKLAALAAAHHAKVVVWLTPLSKARSSVLDDPDVIRYIAELRQIPGLSVFEADRTSPLLSDFRQWHDCSHFHRAVFDQLVAPGVTQLLRQ